MSKLTESDPVRFIGTAFCKKAGIDPKQVRGLDIHLAIGEPPMVTIYSYIAGEAAEGLAAEIARFELLPIEEDAEVPV